MKQYNVPRTRNSNTLTEAQFFGKIRSILRLGIKRCWLPMQQALERNKRPSQHPTNNRLKWEFKCDSCQGWFKRADVEIDHIIPCGSLRNWEDVVPFLQRLTEESLDSYQIVCKDCHVGKSKVEITSRKTTNNDIQIIE